jgi:hypothetical protein
MSGFGMLIEDPFYDEDGVLIDEDADWEDVKEEVEGVEVSYSPYDTLNS